jgi:phosphatidylglycerophosphate synthase
MFLYSFFIYITMNKFNQVAINNTREWRDQKLMLCARFFIRLKVTANIMTSFSLICGILSMYFLFNNYWLFFVFAILHLLADSLDGVLARLTKSTLFGKYFDAGTDSLVTFLAIAKVANYLADYYALIVAFIFLIIFAIHFAFKMRAPIIQMRTASLVVLMVATCSSFAYSDFLLTLGYLGAGILSVVTFGKQIIWFKNDIN